MRGAFRPGWILAALLLVAGAAHAGEVSGRITLAVEGAQLADLGPTVVYLEGGAPSPAPRPRQRPAIRQSSARFDPSFLVVAAGQTVDMPNEDTIFHNVFSMSRPNDFDLGLYPAGESRAVTFASPGLVRLYCSIHESMTGTVLVAPSPWFATATASGEYRLSDVPPGRYRLTAWNEKLPSETREVVVRAGRTPLDLVLGGGGS